MSEQTYSVKDGKEFGYLPKWYAVACGSRSVTSIADKHYAELLTNCLNKEIAPMIEALEEKSLENMQLHERIAELEAALGHCIGTLERTMYANTPNDIQEAIDHAKSVLYKKAGSNE